MYLNNSKMIAMAVIATVLAFNSMPAGAQPQKQLQMPQQQMQLTPEQMQQMQQQMQQQQMQRPVNPFESAFTEAGYKGCFLLYGIKDNILTAYNPDMCNERFYPASTFKILNTLIGLETGVLKDESTVFEWDGTTRPIKEWNQNLDLKSAFSYSAVPYFQEVARRIGEKNMKKWVDLVGYGNCDISGGIDMFWLTGGLKISGLEQINFLKRLYLNQLPFSQRTMDIAKNVMIYRQPPGYIMRAKTGSSRDGKGWFVGWIEREGNAFFFVTIIEGKDGWTQEFMNARIDITLKILREIRLIQE